jgi:dihydrofolate reductase
MTNVILDMSMSLDGFVTASNVRPEEPLGDGGQRLHEWAFGEDKRNRELLAEAVNFVGAVIAGRRTYDLFIPWWGADGPAGPARVPVFVVTHAEPEEVPEGGVYTFVTVRAKTRQKGEATSWQTTTHRLISSHPSQAPTSRTWTGW